VTLLTLALATLALFALFWGVSAVAQGYLYNEPADRLPLRALAAALAVGSFLALWATIDKRNPGKYDTFFEFASYTTTDFQEFDAVRWSVDPTTPRSKPGFRKGANGEPAETVTKFKRAGGNKSAPFQAEKTGESFRLNTSTTVTAAILLPGPDGTASRFTAEMQVPDASGKLVPLKPDMLKGDPKGVVYAPNTRFMEVSGSRYVQAKQLDEHKGVLFVPSSGVVFVALLLNLGHFVVWFLAIWLLLRFGWGHALGAAAAAGLVTMLVILPLLFKPNRTPQVPVPVKETGVRGQETTGLGSAACGLATHRQAASG
jgi:hypothetical protein